MTQSAWFAYRFRRRLLEDIELHRERAGWYRHAHCATYRNWYAWELLFYADHQDRSSEWRIRLRLAELRDLIGPDAYHAGRMPEPVPGILFHDLR